MTIIQEGVSKPKTPAVQPDPAELNVRYTHPQGSEKI